MAELGWRDFAAALLFAHPDLATRPLRPEFERFPWRDDETGFRAWAHGRTGYPIVDAGMRQLWRTGFLPNRVRMIAASFLVKHLLIDWRRGETWFWDTLIDADPASNPLNWQWVAGSGVDSAPYFRIFNPVLQAEKFDPDGAYVRRWVPELVSSVRETSIALGRRRAPRSRTRESCWAKRIPSPSWTTPSPAPARSRRSRRFGAAERPARDCIADPPPPTLSSLNQKRVLFSPFLRKPNRSMFDGGAGEENFEFGFRHNPSKSPDWTKKTKEIQAILFGFIWLGLD